MQTNRGSHRLSFVVGWAMLVAVSLAGGAAAAQGRESAKKHFDNGVELMSLEDFVGAAVEFEASARIYTTRSALFNLAMCYKALHRYGPALETFRSLLKNFGEEMSSEMKKEVRDNIAAMSKLIGEVEIHTSVPGATVLVGGAHAGTTPLPSPLVLGAGEHRIRVSLQGYTDQERVVTLVSGGREVIDFSMTPVGTGAPPPPVVVGTAPPPPVAVGTAPSPPAAAGPRVAAGPPAEVGTIFKLFGIRAGTQAGFLGIVSLAVLLTPNELGYEGIFGITSVVGALGGGLISWGIGNASINYEFPLWGAFIGSFVGGGVSFGLDMAAYHAYGGDFGEMDVDETSSVITLAILTTIIVAPAVEAGFYALFRRPDPVRFPDHRDRDAAPAAPSVSWRPPAPAAFADPDTARLHYGLTFGASF